MKINKILAAGVAATLAVSSLAAVVGAEETERSWDMKVTYGKAEYKPVANQSIAEDLDSSVYGVKNYTPLTSATFANDKGDLVDTNMDGQVDFRDFDGFIPILVESNGFEGDFTGATITVKGWIKDNGTGDAIPKTATTKLQKFIIEDDADNVLANYIAPLYYTSAPEGQWMPTDFIGYDSIKIDTTTCKDEKVSGLYKNEYQTATTGIDKGFYLIAGDAANELEMKSENGNWVIMADDEATSIKNAGVGAGAGTIAYVKFALAPAMVYGDPTDPTDLVAPWFAFNDEAKAQAAITNDYNMDTKTGDFGMILTNYGAATPGNPMTADEIVGMDDTATGILHETAKLIGLNGIVINWKVAATSTYDELAWLPVTDGYPTFGAWYEDTYRAPYDNKTIVRDEVYCLSNTADYGSGNFAAGAEGVHQSYETIKYNKGDAPSGFKGFASQVADFFNKAKKGKITFTFTAKVDDNGTAWNNGGIPSTEVGIKNTLGNMTANDFALFVNYGHTTGSLQAVTEIDAYAGKVSFDISEILDQLNGQTIGVVSDVYYGLTKAASQVKSANGKNGYREGFWVEEVKFTKDDAASATDADAVKTEDDDDDVIADDDDDVIADDDDDDDVTADDDDDIFAEDDDDDDASIIADDDDDDDDVNGETDIVTDDTTEDDDVNPGTGVGLAVIPAIVAAAAAVVSKKRK